MNEYPAACQQYEGTATSTPDRVIDLKRVYLRPFFDVGAHQRRSLSCR
jgi:hypothetical protein